jgi:hypothetical protein
VVRNFHACNFLNQYYQFKTIKPISAQIAAKISIIRANVQMFGDKSAHVRDTDAAGFVVLVRRFLPTLLTIMMPPSSYVIAIDCCL